MHRIFKVLYFALLVLVVPVESAGQDGGLAKLSEVRIIVRPFENEEKELGLNKNEIKEQVLVFLRSKLPLLGVNELAAPYVYILPHLGISSGKSSYYGQITVFIYRPVIIRKTGMSANANVWSLDAIVRGQVDGSAVGTVRNVIDGLLTKFAAAWYVDNP